MFRPKMSRSREYMYGGAVPKKKDEAPGVV